MAGIAIEGVDEINGDSVLELDLTPIAVIVWA
jgi:hypothetical protein